MKKPNWSLELFFVFSLILFTVFLFYYPKTLVYFFFEKTTNDFFIADLNRFTRRYLYTNFFIVYLVYIPFFVLLVFIWFGNRFSKEINFFFSRILVGFIYFHLIAIYVNQYLFSAYSSNDIISFFDTKIKGFDLSYALIQYYGFYWDFFFVSYICFLFFIVFTEKSIIGAYFLYNFPGQQAKVMKSTAFWVVYTFTWAFRLFVIMLIMYFFGGQDILSDCMTLFNTFVVIEFIICIQRFFIIIQRLNLYMAFNC